jgi:hypothetical protein
MADRKFSLGLNCFLRLAQGAIEVTIKSKQRHTSGTTASLLAHTSHPRGGAGGGEKPDN